MMTLNELITRLQAEAATKGDLQVRRLGCGPYPSDIIIYEEPSGVTILNVKPGQERFTAKREEMLRNKWAKKG